MKRRIIIILLSSLLSISVFSCKNEDTSSIKVSSSKDNTSADESEFPVLSSPDMREFSTDYFSTSYDSNVYHVESSEDEATNYYKIICDSIGDVQEGEYNTICGIIESHSFYEEIGSQNVEDYMATFSSQLFNSQRKSIVESNTSYNNGYIETHTVLEDKTEYYVKLLSLNPDTSVIAILRLCEYTSYFNDSLYDIYSSISLNNFTKDYPVVSYTDIQSGKYNGQRVIIEATVDDVQINSNDSNFSLWFSDGDSFIYAPSSSNFSISPVSSNSCFLNLKNGDILRYSTEICDDGSFGTSSVFSSEIIGNRNVEEIRTVFKSSCPLMNYEELVRNPDNHKSEVLQISGKIFQVIEENDYSAEYLLSTDNGYVYINWYSNKEIRGSRILEDDFVTIYGSFEGLKTYNTLSGEQTAPGVSAYFIDLN